MPMTKSFEKRLYPIIEDVADHFGTPFHIYDEKGIRYAAQSLIETFSKFNGFKEFFAVKALPNPRILSIMKDIGFGFDCSSVPELILSRGIGASGEDIMFTSNNTSPYEFDIAFEDQGCILNLDDISLINKIPKMPGLISFRYNPGESRSGNAIIGNPVESKYGLTHNQILEAYKICKAKGAKNFGLHTMLASNELDYRYMVKTTKMLLDIVTWISEELGIRFEFINIGGGLGIPYRPEDIPFDIHRLSEEVEALFIRFNQYHGYTPKLFMESGRFITGPHGVLAVRAINRKDIYRTYIGVDASMSALMRPGIYGAYHHITVPGKESGISDEIVDVVGSLCENNDKFAIQRKLPVIEENDILCIHDTGAHGHSMGFNYNGKLRPKELLMCADGSVELIRREEKIDDYFATLSFENNIMHYQNFSSGTELLTRF